MPGPARAAHLSPWGRLVAACGLVVGAAALTLLIWSLASSEERQVSYHVRGPLSGVALDLADGDVEVTGARVAAPCREFTSFLLKRDDVADRDEIRDEMEFLGEGMRGFIVDGSTLPGPMRIGIGDEVVLRA